MSDLPTVELPVPDIGRLRRSPDAYAALRWLVGQLRSLPRPAGEHVFGVDARADLLWRLVSCHAVARAEAEAVVGSDRLEALRRVHALSVFDEAVIASLAVVFLHRLAVAYPAVQRGSPEPVYIGTEAPWLIKLAYRHGPGAGTAADLATGTGVVAAALSARYERVAATDLSLEAVECAALTLALNRANAVTGAVVADAALGLRPGSFDLVAANPPWVPWPSSKEPPRRAHFSYGGPTGMEIPARFIEQSATLLRPGGVAVILVSDTTWEDGRRPLDEQTALLEAQGFEVEVEPPHPSTWTEESEEELLSSTPGCVDGRLVGLVFRRPHQG